MQHRLFFTYVLMYCSSSYAEEAISLKPLLGEGFGKVITIEGVVATDKDTRLRKHAGAKLLKVESVNDARLRLPVIMELEPFAFAALEIPEHGTITKMRGYETGSFVGIPDEAIENYPAATSRFHFEHRFIVMKVLSSKQRTMSRD